MQPHVVLVSVQILVIASSAVYWSDRVELDFLGLPQKSTIQVYAYFREAMRVETPLPWKDANNSKWQPLNVAAFFYAKMTAGSIGFPIESVSQWQSDQSVHEDGEILSMVCRFYNSDGATLG